MDAVGSPGIMETTMKKLIMLALIAAFFCMAIIPFGPPIDWPDDLDDLVYKIETSERGYVFHRGEPEKPYVSWEMVREIEAQALDDNEQSMLIIPAADLAKIVEPGGITFPTTGMLKISENDLFGLAFWMVFNGIDTCGDADGHPTIYGETVQEAFDILAEDYIEL